MVSEAERVKLAKMVGNQYDTVQLYNYIEGELNEKYLNEEITEDEYMNAMEKIRTGEELADDVNEMKAEKFEDLQEQFVEDEITEEEFERKMDRLFSSGDEFLDVDPNEGPSMQSEAAFRLKETAQVVAVAGYTVLTAYLSLMTMGRALIPMLIMGGAIWFAYRHWL